MEERKEIDWELIERHYRAGIKTVRQLASEYGVSHTAIQKRAKKFSWVRDLTEKIEQTTRNMVATKVVARVVATEQKLSDAATVMAYSEVISQVELTQQDDLKQSLEMTRLQMRELALLGNPNIASFLIEIGKEMSSAVTDDHGVVVSPDKKAELFDYILSLPGRIKMAKELAAAHGVYIPLQRKVFRLDNDGNNANKSAYEDMLRSIGQD